MGDIHAKPIINDKFWVVERDGEKIATLQKQENNKFLLSNKKGDLWFNKKEELISHFGSEFFLPNNMLNINTNIKNDCLGFPTHTKPYNVMYDVRRQLPLYTKQEASSCLHCAGWYLVKFKNIVISFCPKLITVERYETYGPFKTKKEASEFKCNIN